MLKLGLGFIVSVNFVVLCLEIHQGLRMCLLEGFFSLVSLPMLSSWEAISSVRFLTRLKWTRVELCWYQIKMSFSSFHSHKQVKFTMKQYNLLCHTLFSVPCFFFSTLARVSSKSSMSFLSSEHSSSSFFFLVVSSTLISSSSSSLSVVSLSLASSWIILLNSPSHLSSASVRFSDSCCRNKSTCTVYLMTQYQWIDATVSLKHFEMCLS